VRHLGPFSTTRGPLDLYVIPRLDRSKSCVLVLDAKGGGGGGCATDLYHGHAVAWTEGSQGGPEAKAVTERYVAGFAKPGVERVSIVDSAGGLHPVALDAANGFVYEESAPDLKNGLEPAAIVAANQAGVTIDRQSLTNGP
jgi:hypothetical protein